MEPWQLFVYFCSVVLILFCGALILIKVFINEWYEARRDHIDRVVKAAATSLEKLSEDMRKADYGQILKFTTKPKQEE